jgi:hypothetical protein
MLKEKIERTKLSQVDKKRLERVLGEVKYLRGFGGKPFRASMNGIAVILADVLRYSERERNMKGNEQATDL